MADTTPRVNTSTAPKKKSNEAETHSLRGAFTSSMILGALIVLSWLGVFYLFMSRQ